MNRKTLNQIVAEHPFPDFAEWWDVGPDFLGFMSEAIVSEWAKLEGNGRFETVGRLHTITTYVTEYIQTVFNREARASLVDDFVAKQFNTPIQSGEFDALSYAFYRSAFELIESHIEKHDHSVARERRLFTKRVGKNFFSQLHDHLQLNLPSSLDNEHDFVRLKDNIQQVGLFLKANGYLRNHFDFHSMKDMRTNKLHKLNQRLLIT